MQFDFKEKAKKRQDRNSPIKPFFVYNLKIHPKFHGVNSKFLWGLFSPHGVPPFLTAPTKVWLPGKSTERGWRINGNNRQGASPFCISAHKEPLFAAGESFFSRVTHALPVSEEASRYASAAPSFAQASFASSSGASLQMT